MINEYKTADLTTHIFSYQPSFESTLQLHFFCSTLRSLQLLNYFSEKSQASIYCMAAAFAFDPF